MAVLTLYLIFIIVGVADLGWQFAPLAAGLGALLGLCAGIRATSAGIAMGILAGIWIFFEVVALGVVLILEGLAVVLAAALSIFG